MMTKIENYNIFDCQHCSERHRYFLKFPEAGWMFIEITLWTKSTEKLTIIIQILQSWTISSIFLLISINNCPTELN